MTKPRDRLIELLNAKYREDPNRFRAYLPGVTAFLPKLPPEPQRKPRVPLTEEQVSHHREALAKVLSRLDQGVLTPDEAAKGLRHCAALTKDNSLYYTGESDYTDAIQPFKMGHEVKKGLLKVVLGKSPGSYKSKTTVPVDQGCGPVAESLSVITGVYLDLDAQGRLVSISINPWTYRKRRKAMSIIGIGSDTKSDVAERHDDYLAAQDPHGRF